MAKNLITLYLLLFIKTLLYSNNLQISNIQLKNKDTLNNSISIQFDLSWENSWKIENEAANWDAAWIFIKFRIGNGVWQHATLSANSTDHFAPQGSLIEAVSDGVGVFISRSGFGSGNNNWSAIALSWKYGENGVSDNEMDLQIKVFGTEMVYVPTGNYYIGDGRSMGRFYDTGISITSPALINESPVVVRCRDTDYDDVQLESAGILIDGDGGIDTNGITSVDNPDFPTGFGAFYCMKYEISQEQYVEFLNTLTRNQQNSRTIQDVSGTTIPNPYVFNFDGQQPQFRNSIKCVNASGGVDEPVYFFCDLNENDIENEAGDGQNIALINFGWIDGTAYADWAGLRPMTELEYEKACRGPEYPVELEYAWHTIDIYDVEYVLNNSGTETEYPANPGISPIANTSYQYTTGHATLLETPLRCGVFATGNSDRVSSGASYYGIMELSGNANEGCVTLGRIEGRTYRGTHGDGILTDLAGFEGNATNIDWPGVVAGSEINGVTQSLGSGTRGGDWNDTYSHVSMRILAAGDPYGRNPGSGFRCVRSIK